MRLYILRHGRAGLLSNQDREPQLTQVGQLALEKNLLWFKKQAPDLEEIWFSPLLRAQQTKDCVLKLLGQDIPTRKDSRLLPNEFPESLDAELSTTAKQSLLMISHMPFVAELTAHLTGGPTMNFETGTLVCLETNQPRAGKYALSWKYPDG